MGLKLLFWNINKKIAVIEINSLINRVLKDNEPDIFCIAEGPKNKKDLALFIKLIEDKDYVSYYNPIIHSNLKSQITTGKQSHFSLKIFHKKSVVIDRFDFTKAYSSGRVVSLIFKFNSIEYCTIFIHAKSKAEKDKQDKFYSDFANDIKSISRDQKNLLIIGDFNLEPWESKLNSDSYIVSTFLKNKFDYLCEINKTEIQLFNKKIFFNPIIKYLESVTDINQFATFYKNKYSIFDFPLISNQIVNYKFNVINEIGSKSLYISSPRNKKVSLSCEIDHLPIMLTLV